MLPRKTQEILDNTVGALRLFVEFFAVFQSLWPNLPARSEQLAITKDRGEGIVQLVRDTRDQLPDRSHFFTVQQLFLGAPKIVVSLPRLVVQKCSLNRTGNLAANSDQQVDVRGREVALHAASHNQTAYDFVF